MPTGTSRCIQAINRHRWAVAATSGVSVAVLILIAVFFFGASTTQAGPASSPCTSSGSAARPDCPATAQSASPGTQTIGQTPIAGTGAGYQPTPPAERRGIATGHFSRDNPATKRDPVALAGRFGHPGIPVERVSTPGIRVGSADRRHVRARHSARPVTVAQRVDTSEPVNLGLDQVGDTGRQLINEVRAQYAYKATHPRSGCTVVPAGLGQPAVARTSAQRNLHQ